MPEKLAILVPDGAYPLILTTLLEQRRASLKLRLIPHAIIKDAYRDNSREAAALLRPYLRECSHALLLRDLHGSGAEERGAAPLEAELLDELCANGWRRDSAAVIVVDPEVEAWLRFESIHLQHLISERARRRKSDADLLFPQKVNEAIAANGGMNGMAKPLHPKEVLEHLLEVFGVRRSNALYEKLAQKEGLHGCRVPSFQRLVRTLQDWFPDSDGAPHGGLP